MTGEELDRLILGKDINVTENDRLDFSPNFKVCFRGLLGCYHCLRSRLQFYYKNYFGEREFIEGCDMISTSLPLYLQRNKVQDWSDINYETWFDEILKTYED